MPNPRVAIPIVLVLLAGWFCVFTVEQGQVGILLRLGDIQAADIPPGLHFKIPVIDKVRIFPSRLLNLDSEPERFLTSEKKAVIVDLFVMWQINDVATYYKTTGGDERKAALLLFQQVNNGLRAEFGKRTIQEVVSGQRSDIIKDVTQAAREQGKVLGVAVADVRTKRIDLPSEVSNAVYDRMKAEREKVARNFRSRGAEQAEGIRANADRERTVVLAEAYRDGERARGEGDAQAANIYAQAYGKHAEFYAFYRSLSAYKSAFGNANDILLIQPDSEFFNYFKHPSGRTEPAGNR